MNQILFCTLTLASFARHLSAFATDTVAIITAQMTINVKANNLTIILIDSSTQDLFMNERNKQVLYRILLETV